MFHGSSAPVSLIKATDFCLTKNYWTRMPMFKIAVLLIVICDVSDSCMPTKKAGQLNMCRSVLRGPIKPSDAKTPFFIKATFEVRLFS